MNILSNIDLSFDYYSKLFEVPISCIKESNNSLFHNIVPANTKIKIPGYQLIKKQVSKDVFFQWTHDEKQRTLVANNLDDIEFKSDLELNIPQKIKEFSVNTIDCYSYEYLQNDIENLITQYPFIKEKNIGYSVLNKNITELRIGKGNEIVHVNAAIHGNEWITTAVLMKFINEYALSLVNKEHIWHNYTKKSFENKTLSIVPMLNPDGVNLVLNGLGAAEHLKDNVSRINSFKTSFSNWKANINGVDLNKNFPAKWEVEANRFAKNPSPRDFSGIEPLTEPEVKAIVALTKANSFQRVTCLHTQGEELYWHFGNSEVKGSRGIVQEYERVSGYRAVKILNNYAGYKDWFIQKYNKPGFTIELGRGINPLPIEQFDEIYMKTKRILLANLYLN